MIQNINNITEEKCSVKVNINRSGRFSGAEIKVYHDTIDGAKIECLRVAKEIKAIIMENAQQN